MKTKSGAQESGARGTAYALALERGTDDFAHFAHIASHNLKEPLRAISIFAERLHRDQADKLDARAQEMIGYILDGVRTMNGLVDDLFEYSQFDSSPVPRLGVSLNEVFDEAVASFQEAIQESGASVTRDDLPTVAGDKLQLIELLKLLIGNAIKFRSQEPPQIHVSSVRYSPEESSAQLLISIRDNGIGIDAGFGEKIFKLFKKLHSREKYAGNGLGLAICQKIVERHGGRIWVESKPGKGATFFFTIPEYERGALER